MKYLSSLIVLLFLSVQVIAQDTTKLKSTEPISDLADVEPQFPGGPEAMMKFIQSHVVYPEYSKEHDEQGTVYVQFIVNTDGSLSDVVVLKSVTPALDAEAIRVIKLMPNWTPGEQKGKLVRVRYVLPINFLIYDNTSKDEEEDKKKKKRK